MKKKIALLACGWASQFLIDFINGIKEGLKDFNADLYVFVAYNFVEFNGYPNTTGFSIFSIINYEDFDGIVILADTISSPRILEKERIRIVKSGKPAFSINQKLEGLSCLKIENKTSTAQLIQHLIEVHNITDFAYIRGKEKNVDFAERYMAFLDVLKKNDIKVNIDQVYEVESANFQWGYNFFTDYFSRTSTLPQAFVCANDELALGLYKAAEEANIKIPEDIKVVAHDDIEYSSKVFPPLTTAINNVFAVGKEIGKRLLDPAYTVQWLEEKTSAVIRQSCGCKNSESDKINTNQDFTLRLIANEQENTQFSYQLGTIGDIFTEAGDVFTLLTNLDNFFSNSHKAEGSDFCIFLKSDWTSVLINSEENLPQNLSFGDSVQSIVSVQNNKKYSREVINTSSLIPSKMFSDENNTYVFMPIFNHSYVFGYVVQKNNLSFIKNHKGYTWTHSFGVSIERFRKRNMFKQMSQQFMRLSTKDALSGCMNRVGMEKIVIPFYEENKKNGLTSILFFVDINKMKFINDNFGHLHGDLAVKTLAQSIMEVVPRNWYVIRYGGDEFLIVGNNKIYNGEDYSSLIKERLAKKTSLMRLPYILSASIGSYAVPPDAAFTLEEAVKKADEVMYIQKQEFHRLNDSN